MKIADIKTRLGLSEQASEEELGQVLNQARDIIEAFRTQAERISFHSQTSPQDMISFMVDAESKTVSELRGRITTMSQEVSSLKNEILEADALRDLEKFGAGAIITVPMKESLIKMHIENKEGAIHLMSALPKATHLTQRMTREAPPTRPTSQGLTPVDDEIKRNMA